MRHSNFVICGFCGNVFRSMIQLGGSYSNITLRGNLQQCPECKNMVRLPKGVFNSARNAANILASEDNPIELIKALISALEKLQNTPLVNAEELLVAFQETQIKQAEQLAKSAPKNEKDQRLWASALIGTIKYVTTKFPKDALSWIALFEKIKQIIGFSSAESFFLVLVF